MTQPMCVPSVPHPPQPPTSTHPTCFRPVSPKTRPTDVQYCVVGPSPGPTVVYQARPLHMYVSMGWMLPEASGKLPDASEVPGRVREAPGAVRRPPGGPRRSRECPRRALGGLPGAPGALGARVNKQKKPYLSCLTCRLIFVFLLSNFCRPGNRSGWLGDFVSGP